MDKPMNVCVLVGSLRKASINRMLANALISLALAATGTFLLRRGHGA